jgi:DNA-binding FadR family transcriptional regulator
MIPDPPTRTDMDRNSIARSTPPWAMPVVSGTLAQHIVSRVRAALFAGQIKPGEFLGSEAGIAEQFNVSRMASRDALRTLEALGIVDIRKGIKGGAWIAHDNPERFADALAIQLQLIGLAADEIFDAQLAIETHAAELAAARATPEHLAALRQALAACDAAGRDLPTFTAMSIRFHEHVVQASCNRVLLAQFRALRFVLQPLLEPNTTSEVAQRVIRSHGTLLRAIEAGNAAEAGAVMRQRIIEVRARVVGQQRPAASGRSAPRKR